RLPRFLEGISVETVCLYAESQYRPKSLFNGKLVLFRATSGEAGDQPFADRFDDPDLGWSSRATDGVQVLDVPGGHYSMLQEPNVAVLAAQMTHYIEMKLAVDGTTHAACTARG